MNKLRFFWAKLKENKKLAAGIAAIFLLLLAGVFFIGSRKEASFQGKNVLPDQSFEPEDARPDVRRETLPDGRKVEYGTRDGPLTPEREEELRKIIEEEKRRSSSGSQLNIVDRLTLNKIAFAGSAADDLVVEDRTGNPANEDRIREMFQNNEIYWTEGELPKLRKIVIVTELMGGRALGAYDYVKITDAQGNFQDWQGIIWVVSYSSGGMTVAHEYGHHFTDYWAAHRTGGSWGDWPATEVGDYYQMRPLPTGCHCASYGCPYHLHVWEILAEDFRHTTSAFDAGHMFAGLACQGGGGSIPWPDKQKTAAYLKSLPFGLTGVTPTITPAAPTDVSTPSPTIDSGFTPPVNTPAPTATPTLPPCPTGYDDQGRTIKLKSWYPCR